MLKLEPLTPAAFEPFGTVLQSDPMSMKMINGGWTERFHGLAEVDIIGEGARTIINIFRGQPRIFPYVLTMMERHPLGSQSFSPLSSGPWLSIVAEDEDGKPGRPRAFLCRGDQGVNYGRNIWHHPLMTIGSVCDFLVVDRDGPGENLEEFFYPEPWFVPNPL